MDEAEGKKIGERRLAKRLARLRKKRARRRALNRRFRGEESRKYESPILDLFASKRFNKKALKKNGPKTFVAPKVFSISRNTAECLKFFKSLVEYARTTRKPKLILDQRGITELGLGADSVLGVILSEIRAELRFTPGAYIRGRKPKSQEIQRIMDDVGSVRALFMDTEEDIKISLSTTAKIYRHRHRPSQASDIRNRADTTSRVITDFSDHLDECLNYLGKRLSTDGRDRLCHYAGEVLDNAKEHSGLNDWLIVGHADFSDGKPIYRCVIFSFGNTIAQTFQVLPDDSFARSVIKPYLLRHERRALFNTVWREEDLLTVVALQGDVSSKNTSPETDRGQGTVELIEFFQKVSVECGLRWVKPEMNIVSGSTRIRFDGRYQMTYRPDLNRDVIAFNQNNDLFDRPDDTAVIALGDAVFPGVLISIEMPLLSEFMEVAEDVRAD